MTSAASLSSVRTSRPPRRCPSAGKGPGGRSRVPERQRELLPAEHRRRGGRRPPGRGLHGVPAGRLLLVPAVEADRPQQGVEGGGEVLHVAAQGVDHLRPVVGEVGADVLVLHLLVHRAHGSAVDQVVEDPRHGAPRARGEAAEHHAVEQQAHRARRGARNLPEGDVLLVLVGRRQHVALGRP
eukprot:16433410-Heterocapsa_arctica.AAC.1